MTIKQFEEFLLLSGFSNNQRIWYSNDSSPLSYPEDDHNDYFKIEENSYWFLHRNKSLLTLIKKYSPDQLFFDIGGGNGFVSKAIEDENIPVVLVEPGHDGVKNAKIRGLRNIFCGSIQDISGLKGEIHSIGTFDVIEHIEDDSQFVISLFDLLVSGGFLYLTVPAYKSLWSDEDVRAGHFRRYRLKTITTLLKKIGFEIEYSTYFFSILLFPLFLIRTLPSKFGIKKNTKSNMQKEHKNVKGVIGAIINFIWGLELRNIQKGKTIPFGTSCLIVAKKR